ncbi:MAG: S-layer homology domain-containing protein, partial [Bacillota bacterium]
MRSVKWKFLISCVMLLIALSPAGSAFARPTDIAGHWAVGQIGDWINKGLASGYPDGTFRPDNTISRAEFVTMANSAFGFNQTGQVNFTDVDSTKWFAGEVSKARAAGYISGYEDGTFRPENQISRQEAASMLAGILKSVTSENTGALSAFKDAGSIPQWSRGSVAAVVARGFMSGYPDQTYRPDKPITRAEALSTLDRALQKARDVTYGKAGTYGPATGVKTIDGNATVSAAGVSLQNLVITGDLLLAQSIGEGDVRLKNVTVKGNTIIKGGGSHSVVLEDCTLPNITVDKDGVRVVASGNTRVNIVRLESGATLVEVTATGNGFENVTVSQVIPAEAKVTLEGNFDQVEVAANKVNIEVAAGKVDKLTVAENATETNVSVAKEATVESATLNSAATISGEGKVKEATVNATGAKIIQTPEKVTVAPSVTTSVGGKETTNTSNSSVTTSNSTGSNTGGGSGGGGSGGGGSSRGSDTTAPAFASTYPKTANVTTTGFDLLVQTNENGNAYFVVLSNNAPPPTAAQVKAGQDSAGTALANSLKGTINLTANTQASSTISGLSASTGYDICVVAEDYVPNVQAGVVKVDVTTTAQDLTPPSYVSAELSNGNKKATLTFSEYIVNNTADAALKDAVTLAADGINYAALTAGDSVSITSGQLVITFENPLVSASNRIRVNADTLRDAAGNVKSDITVTGAIDASYEPDDTFAQATLISTDGTAQRHRIDPATDQDWIKFIAQAGQSYRIRTSNLFPPEINNAVTDMNTWIYLYDTDGTTKLKDNDDSDIDLGESAPLWSLIDWTAPATGNLTERHPEFRRSRYYHGQRRKIGLRERKYKYN